MAFFGTRGDLLAAFGAALRAKLVRPLRVTNTRRGFSAKSPVHKSRAIRARRNKLLRACQPNRRGW